MKTPGILGVAMHANAVAEDGPAGNRARGIDRRDRDRSAASAKVSDVGIDQGRLASPGRAAEADHGRVAGRRVSETANRIGMRAALLDERKAARKRGGVAATQPVDKCSECGRDFRRQ
jgi:hypothetical protein